jgi:PPOX class probable F420-dependent enzyme
VKLDPHDPALRSLIDEPSPATLTLYREDGRAVTSPVWFRLEGDAFEVAVAAADAKLEHLRRDPRCVLLVFETIRPFRGIQVRATASIAPDDGARVRDAVATRYLGAQDGAAYSDVDRRPPGYVIRLPVSAARAWDLSDALP